MEVYALLLLRQFSKALPLVNDLLNEKLKVRSDLKMDAEWVNIIIHIELSNYSLIKNLTKRAMGASKTIKQHLTFEKELGAFFNRMAKLHQAGKKPEIKSYAAVFLKHLHQTTPQELEYVKNWLGQLAAM
jgi:hypothetical protein